jgi:hypothetical protein
MRIISGILAGVVLGMIAAKSDASSFTNTGPLALARESHTASLLSNGKILVAGGGANGTETASAELFDPATGAWTATGSMVSGRIWHVAAALPNGKVLVAGGYGPSGLLASAELYDPSTGAWAETGALNIGRSEHTATLLPNGNVLVAGGYNYEDGDTPTSAELYDPTTELWTPTGSLAGGRTDHTATLLPNGKVLVEGGGSSFGELYDPSTETWTVTGAMEGPRSYHTATLLLSGEVLIAGGQDASGITTNAELFDVGLGFSNSWQPQISAVTSPLSSGGNLALLGSGFLGVSEGSGGTTQTSPANYPVVQWRGIESGQTAFLLSTNWSDTTLDSTMVPGFPVGFAMVTVFVDGIPSLSSMVNVGSPVPAPPLLTGLMTLTNGAFQFTFANTPGAVFGVLATTNLGLSLTNWTSLGGVTEIAPGQFQFIDLQATNYSQRFYIVRSF